MLRSKLAGGWASWEPLAERRSVAPRSLSLGFQLISALTEPYLTVTQLPKRLAPAKRDTKHKCTSKHVKIEQGSQSEGKTGPTFFTEPNLWLTEGHKWAFYGLVVSKIDEIAVWH